MTYLQAYWKVQGKVQGVGFRQATVNEADSLGVSGWVRNLPDGSVEVMADGLCESVESLIEWTRKGPPSAQVTNVTVTSKSESDEGNTKPALFVIR